MHRRVVKKLESDSSWHLNKVPSVQVVQYVETILCQHYISANVTNRGEWAIATARPD